MQDELQKYDSGATVTPDGENFKVVFTSKSEYTLKKNGTIEKIDTEITSKINALIGETVDDYKENSGNVNSWRVFYASDEEMFLISSNKIKPIDAFGSENRNSIGIKKR